MSDTPLYPEDILHDIRTHDFAFVQAKNSIDIPAEDIGFELEQLKTQFIKLKDQFKALEKKRALLEVLNGDTSIPALEAQMAKTTEEMKASSQKFDEIRKNMRDLKKEFQGVTGEIAAKWETMQAALNKLHKVFDPVSSKRNRLDMDAILAENEASHAYGKASVEELRMDSEERARAVFEKQYAVAQEIVEENVVLDNQLLEAKEAIQPILEAIDQVKRSIAEIEENSRKSEPLQEKARVELQEIKALREMTQSMGGMEIDTTGIFKGVIRIKFKSLNIGLGRMSPQATLSIVFKTLPEGKMVLDDATLMVVGCASDPRAIRDIVDYAKEIQDIGFLVRQVQSRLVLDQ